MRISTSVHFAIWFVAVLFCLSAHGQEATVGNCDPGEADAYLDVGNVRARIPNTGTLFYRGEPHVYNVPKWTNSNAIFSAGLLMGGFVGDQLRVASSRYGPYEFWPGPIPESADNEPPTDCHRFDRVYSVYLKDAVTYTTPDRAPADLLDWPWQLGAPVIDGDGIPGNYDLDAGDRPHILGDQMVWAVMNDRGNVHPQTESPPLGVEVRLSAYAFGINDDAVVAPLLVKYNSTFYRYQITNRNTTDIRDAYVGMFIDADLGDAGDDRVASDTTFQIGYFYNADDDDTGFEGYHESPPAIGMTVIRGPYRQASSSPDSCEPDPSRERLDLTNFLAVNKGGGWHAEPRSGPEVYGAMRSVWNDGEHLRLGNEGYDAGATELDFSYPGDPITGSYWSELNMDGNGTVRSAADKRAVWGVGPFCLKAGATDEVVFAIVWSRGANHLDSIRQLREDVTPLLHFKDAFISPGYYQETPPPPDPQYDPGVSHNFPNPFSDTTYIRYSVQDEAFVSLEVFDVVGRSAGKLVDEWQLPGPYEVAFDGQRLPTGLYFYRIQIGRLSKTMRMVVIH